MVRSILIASTLHANARKFIQAEARIAFAKILRELDLDVDPPATGLRPLPYEVTEVNRMPVKRSNK
jgi:hypothetical protein